MGEAQAAQSVTQTRSLSSLQQERTEAVRSRVERSHVAKSQVRRDKSWRTHCEQGDESVRQQGGEQRNAPGPRARLRQSEAEPMMGSWEKMRSNRTLARNMAVANENSELGRRAWKNKGGAAGTEERQRLGHGHTSRTERTPGEIRRVEQVRE